MAHGSKATQQKSGDLDPVKEEKSYSGRLSSTSGHTSFSHVNSKMKLYSKSPHI